MYFIKLVKTFILVTCIVGQEQYEKYYKKFEDHLIKQYRYNREIVKVFMQNLRDEEVVLRLSQETLENSKTLNHELSKYIFELIPSQSTTPQTEENYLTLTSIAILIFVTFFLIGCIFYLMSSKSIPFVQKHENTNPKKESK